MFNHQILTCTNMYMMSVFHLRTIYSENIKKFRVLVHVDKCSKYARFYIGANVFSLYLFNIFAVNSIYVNSQKNLIRYCFDTRSVVEIAQIIDLILSHFPITPNIVPMASIKPGKGA